MQQISADTEVQTVLTTYDVTPGTFLDLLEELQEAYSSFICHQPGFVAASIHVNDARTRIANYSQWTSRQSFQALLRSEEMRAKNRRLTELSKSFEPVMYEVVAVFS